MDIPQRLSLCCACLASLAMAGCAASYPYQPYAPYQQYPGGYYGQPNYMGPSMGVPPGGVQLNAPTPIEPGTSGGGTSGGGGDAPMWNPDSSGSGSSGGSNGSSKNVPFYDDPNSGDLGTPPSSTNKPDTFENEKSTFETDQNPFGLNESPTVESPGVRNVAFESDAETKAAVKAPAPIELTNAEFERPVERSSNPEELSLPYNPEEIPNPFGHDPEGYRFLRGLVSYDDQQQAWAIIYDDKPAREDKFGGVFTLADHPGLTVLNENDVVYLEGHVSDTLMDDDGKPCYIVEHLSKLKPRSQE